MPLKLASLVHLLSYIGLILSNISLLDHTTAQHTLASQTDVLN